MSDLEHGSTVGGSLILTQANISQHNHVITDIVDIGDSAYFNKSDSYTLNDSNSIATSKALHDFRSSLGNSAFLNKSDAYSSANSNVIATSAAVNSLRTYLEGKIIHAAGYVAYSGTTPSLIWSKNSYYTYVGNGEFNIYYYTYTPSSSYIPIIIENSGGVSNSFITTNYTSRVNLRTRSLSYSTSWDSGEMDGISFSTSTGIANFYYMIVEAST